MFKDLKKELLSNPQFIVNILDYYEFYKIHIQSNEIRCGLYEQGNPTAIRIKLKNNDNLYVTDYVRNLNCDLISYIIKVRNVQFSDVLGVIKSELGIQDFYNFTTKRTIFGGFYDRIKNKTTVLPLKTYNNSILEQYHSVYNMRFLKDNIGFETQDKFNIGYDIESQRITIPIYNEYGELVGIKGRANWDVSEDEVKYLYLIPCAMSQTLYGCCQNYDSLAENDIYVFEAEKSVLQCHSYGIHNAVALGSHSLSTQQCKLIMSLNPKRVIFLLDKGLEIEKTMNNIEKLQSFTRMFSTGIWWWDWRKNQTFNDKDSPSDKGRSALEQIIREEVVRID